MASQSELEHSAGDHARKTSWNWDKYLSQIRNDPTYAYKNTEWYKAGTDLEKTKAASSGGGTPPPQPSSHLETYRRWSIMAQNPLDALQSQRAGETVAFTADPAYDSYAPASAADQVRAAGKAVAVWYVPTQVSSQRAEELAKRLGTSLILGQCETPDEFDQSMAQGRTAMVGNVSVLSDAQLNEVKAARAIVIVELYRNCQPWQVPDWRSANAGIPGNCIAVYADATPCTYTPVSDYIARGMFNKDQDSVYGPGMTPSDWAALS